MRPPTFSSSPSSSSTTTIDDRPAWAANAGLPARSSLTYVQALAGAIALASIVSWGAYQLANHPGQLATAIRRRLEGRA